MNKKIVIIVVMFVAAIPVFYTTLFVTRVGEVAVTFITAPEDANITMNNNPVGQGVTYFSEGEYQLEVSRDGFEPYSTNITVEDGSINTVAIPMTPISPEGFDIYNQSLDRYLLVEEAAGIVAVNEGDRFRENNPIVGELPYNSKGLIINYRLDGDGGLVLEATVANYSSSIEVDAESIVSNTIAELGYEPSDFKVEYTDSHPLDLPTLDENFTVEVVEENNLLITLHPLPEDLFDLNPTYTEQDYQRAKNEALRYIQGAGYDASMLKIEYTRLDSGGSDRAS